MHLDADAHPPSKCALVQALDGDVQTLFKGAAETVHAVEVAKSVEWKLNWLLGVTGTGLGLMVGAFVWLFTQQQHANAAAVEIAGREARTVVAEQDRHFAEKATEIAREAVRLDREARAHEGLVVTAR